MERTTYKAEICFTGDEYVTGDFFTRTEAFNFITRFTKDPFFLYAKIDGETVISKPIWNEDGL